jgi:protein-disulfide isomerase
VKLGEVLGTVLSAIAVTCAVTITALVVRNELFHPARTQPGADPWAAPLESVRNWRAITSGGHRFGTPDAKVVLVEFADFECPFCAGFANTTLKAIRQEFGPNLAVVFRQWPLPYHKNAYPAARAAECAGQQDRFEAFAAAVYQKQDSLGLKSFRQFAREAEVLDLETFDRCNSRTDKVESVEQDIQLARDAGARGTPTLVVNGKRLPAVPDSARLERIILTALKEGKPGKT